MEVTSSVFSSSSSLIYPYSPSRKPQFVLNSNNCYLPLDKRRSFASLPHNRAFPRSSVLRASAVSVDTVVENSTESIPSPATSRDSLPKIDKSGKLCNPRAARELALLTIYGACLEGSDPIRLFERRMNTRREPGYQFEKTLLTVYNHMTFGGPPVEAETVEEADELLRIDNKESAVEAEVLSAPPKLVYSKLMLRFSRKLLVAVADSWNDHVLVIDKIAPSNWKNEPAGRILELSILHLAMAEISVLGTRHQIVINEAVDLAKRFCDGAAARIINGCLRTFIKDLEASGKALGSQETKRRLVL